jgi:hypothetical protein
LKINIPKIAVPAAPIPVQIAYEVPIGRVFAASASSEKLSAAHTKNPMEGSSRLNPSESFRKVANPTSNNPATIMSSHAMVTSVCRTVAQNFCAYLGCV